MLLLHAITTWNPVYCKHTTFNYAILYIVNLPHALPRSITICNPVYCKLTTCYYHMQFPHAIPYILNLPMLLPHAILFIINLLHAITTWNPIYCKLTNAITTCNPVYCKLTTCYYHMQLPHVIIYSSSSSRTDLPSHFQQPIATQPLFHSFTTF